MEEYKQYLNDNADDDERRAAAQVMEGLAGLRLEARVREAAAERAALRRRSRRIRVGIWMVALALVAGAAFFVLGKKETPAPSNAPARPNEQAPDRPILRPASEGPSALPADEPIARLRPEERLPNPRYPAPDATMIRGDESENKAHKALLDQLWYADYPLKGLKTGEAFKKADENLKKRDFSAAYLALEALETTKPDNDTLAYLKAYCLMEMGQGEEALVYFDPIQGRHAAWEPQLQWYRGLAMLLAGQQEKARSLFQKVERQPKHPYRRQAEKAAGLLSK